MKKGKFRINYPLDQSTNAGEKASINLFPHIELMERALPFFVIASIMKSSLCMRKILKEKKK
ncbi:hypothetical protein ACI2OX_04925 [Bacillus sp. N9]